MSRYAFFIETSLHASIFASLPQAVRDNSQVLLVPKIHQVEIPANQSSKIIYLDSEAGFQSKPKQADWDSIERQFRTAVTGSENLVFFQDGSQVAQRFVKQLPKEKLQSTWVVQDGFLSPDFAQMGEARFFSEFLMNLLDVWTHIPIPKMIVKKIYKFCFPGITFGRSAIQNYMLFSTVLGNRLQRSGLAKNVQYFKHESFSRTERLLTVAEENPIMFVDQPFVEHGFLTVGEYESILDAIWSAVDDRIFVRLHPARKHFSRGVNSLNNLENKVILPSNWAVKDAVAIGFNSTFLAEWSKSGGRVLALEHPKIRQIIPRELGLPKMDLSDGLNEPLAQTFANVNTKRTVDWSRHFCDEGLSLGESLIRLEGRS